MNNRITSHTWTHVQRPRIACNKKRVQVALYATIINSGEIGTTAATTYLSSIQSRNHNILSYPSTQPPSFKPPEFRKSQLLRQYASLLQSSPLMLIFQHNNIKANEWVALRRELASALRNTDKSCAIATADGSEQDGQRKTYKEYASLIKIQTVQTGIFSAALRVVDYFKNDLQNSSGNSLDGHSSNSHPRKSSSTFTHSLSKAANRAAVNTKTSHELSPLLSGPICVMYFPAVSPPHIKQAISILSPNLPDFPAPRKKSNPGWHDPAVQEAVQKLILLGARVEKRTFDVEGIKKIGCIEGGLEGLQGQLVALLQSAGVTITSTLGSAGQNIYFTLNSRKIQLEDSVDIKSNS